MKFYFCLALLFLIGILLFLIDSKKQIKIFLADDHYRSKIAYLYNNNLQGEKEALIDLKVKAHIRYVNQKNSDFRMIIKNVADIEFDSIELDGDNLIVTADKPDEIMIYYFHYIDSKSLNVINECFSMNFDKISNLESLLNEECYKSILEKMKTLSIPTSSCFTDYKANNKADK